MTKHFLVCALAVLLSGRSLAAADPAREFLRFIYGAENVKITEVCWPNDDVWMIAGPKNDSWLAEIPVLKHTPGKDEVFWENIAGELCIVEMRAGKADPRFVLDQIYFLQRQRVLRFVYAALERNMEALGEVTTDPKKLSFGKTKPARPGDMDVYAELIAILPVVRISTPAADKASKSISYALPLGPRGFTVRLVKRKGAWVVDTDKGLDVPLEIFFKENAERKIIYAP